MTQVAIRSLAFRPTEQFAAVSGVDRLVRCVLGAETFALPLEQVAEVVALGIAPAPAPRGWVGTLVRGDRPVPIGDLAFLLGLPAAPAGRHERRAILLRGAPDQTILGVTVDAVPTVIDAAGIGLQPLPPVARRTATGLIRGSVVLGGSVLLVLDAETIRERLGVGLVRGDAGQITELRALPRRVASDQGWAAVERDAPPIGPLADDLQALVIAPVETADGGDGFAPALAMGWVQEVRPFSPPRRLPHAPSAVVGLIERRGRALPVLDLVRRLTGIPGAEHDPRRRLLIIGEPGAEPLGALLVPGVRGLRTLARGVASPSPVPETIDPALVWAWAGDSDESVAVLDPAGLFA
jgi:chemotaxis signal transduction protein